MPKKICVVDAEKDIRDVIGYLLSDEGYSVIALDPGILDLPDIIKVRPDLIILDVAVIFPSTLRLYQNLKQEKSLKDVPLILLSTSVDLNPIKSLGADRVIAKPFNFGDLLKEIESIGNT